MKKIVSILVLISVIVSITTIVNATDLSMSLSPDKEEVEKGSEVKVMVAINGFTRAGDQKAVQAKISYDSQKLEFVKTSWQSGWTGTASADGTGFSMIKSGTIEEQENIVEITYKVKEDSSIGNTTITADKIQTSTDGDSVMLNSASVAIEIVEEGQEPPQQEPSQQENTLTGIEITTTPGKTEYTEGESFDPSGIVIMAKYSDGSSKEIQGYTYSPAGELKASDKEIIISYTEGGVTKTTTVEITVASKAGNDDSSNVGTNVSGNGETNDSGNSGTNGSGNGSITITNKGDNTISEKDYPKTGAKTVILPICILAVFAIVSYIRYKRYRKI